MMTNATKCEHNIKGFCLLCLETRAEEAEAALADKDRLLWAMTNYRMSTTLCGSHPFIRFKFPKGSQLVVSIIDGVPQMPDDQEEAAELREAIDAAKAAQ